MSNQFKVDQILRMTESEEDLCKGDVVEVIEVRYADDDGPWPYYVRRVGDESQVSVGVNQLERRPAKAIDTDNEMFRTIATALRDGGYGHVTVGQLSDFIDSL